MNVKPFLRSFAGGVITGELFGRLDLPKYQTGLKQAVNFITLPHGPALRRGGTRMILEAKDSTQPVRYIPFSFSAEQTAVIELGHMYARFHIGGATLLETAQAIGSIVGTTVNLVGHGYAVGDWVFIGTRFYKIDSVPDADSFIVADLWSVVLAPVGTTAARVYTISTPYDGADVFDLDFAQDADVLTLSSIKYTTRELRRMGATNWTLTALNFAPTLTAPTGLGAAATIAVNQNLSPQRYTVTAVDADGIVESLAATAVSVNNNLSLAGNYNTVSWSAVAGAARYNVYKQRGGAFGFIGQTAALTIIDDNVAADTTKTPPDSLITLNDAPGKYPSAVTYHEQRRFLGGTANNPQSIYGTRSGTGSNLTSSVPTRADDAMQFRVAALQQNRIRYLVPLSDLMVLTAGGEWRIFSDGEPALTPTSLSVKPMGFSGAARVKPVLTSGSVLYVQALGSRVRELAYRGGDGGGAYGSIDMSVMATHLFDGYSIVDMTYARAPIQLAWAVRSDGIMLGMTYLPEQSVYGWHTHVTDGIVESHCTVAEGNADVTYLGVRREVNGRSVRYLERMEGRFFGEQSDSAFFVDCGLTYTGPATSTIGGLWHLEGKEVSVLGNGADLGDYTVVDGSITLREPLDRAGNANIAHVGLPYISDLETLPLALEGVAAAGQGSFKNVQAVHLRTSQTSIYKVGPSFDKLQAARSRLVSDNYGQTPSLRSREERVTVPGDWDTDGTACVRQDRPLPLTVVAMTLDVAVGG